MSTGKKIKWTESIQTRQIIGFTVITVFMIVSSVILQIQAMNLAVETTYEKMNANAEYFLESFENEIAHVHQLQIEFFNDRKLTFLESPEVNISEYERREALLSVRERLQTITGVSRLVKNGILCLPESDYWIEPSGIRGISEPNREALKTYLADETSSMHFDGTDFFMTVAGAVKSKTGALPRHILIITFSQEAIKQKISVLNTSGETGAFFYLEEAGHLISSAADTVLDHEIYGQLKRDELGGYLDVQRIKIGREWYLVCVGGTGDMGMFVQYAREAPIMKSIHHFRRMMIAVIVIMIVIAVFFIIYMRILIHRPIGILLEAFSNLESGDWSTRIQHQNEDEFQQLYKGFNDMKDRISRLIEEVYVQTNLAQRAELKQLQAQINPHFLYNSFFILSRRIKREDYENAGIIAEHLGTYFQFLTRNEADYIPLKKEVEHARSYVDIQAARFVGRIVVQFDSLPEECAQIKVPRLILQPLLENVFEHGLYHKAENGMVRVSFIEEPEVLQIIVEDNGDELTDEAILNMQELLVKEDNGEITGVVNIHKRLTCYFNGKGGLGISRSALGGLKITILIDKGEHEDGTELADCR